MDASHPQLWLRAAVLVGVAYVVVGRVFAVPVSHVQAWRLAAWLVCGVAFAAHIAYEHFKLRYSPLPLAFHTAVAVAIGAFLLAVAAMVRSQWTTSTIRPIWFLALFLWPAITAIPAFVVALVAGAALARLSADSNLTRSGET